MELEGGKIVHHQVIIINIGKIKVLSIIKAIHVRNKDFE